MGRALCRGRGRPGRPHRRLDCPPAEPCSHGGGTPSGPRYSSRPISPRSFSLCPDCPECPGSSLPTHPSRLGAPGIPAEDAGMCPGSPWRGLAGPESSVGPPVPVVLRLQELPGQQPDSRDVAAHLEHRVILLRVRKLEREHCLRPHVLLPDDAWGWQRLGQGPLCALHTLSPVCRQPRPLVGPCAAPAQPGGYSLGPWDKCPGQD